MRNTPFPQPEQLRKRAELVRGLYCSLWVGTFHAHNTVSIAPRNRVSLFMEPEMPTLHGLLIYFRNV